MHPIRELIVNEEDLPPPMPEEQKLITAQMRTMVAEMFRQMTAQVNGTDEAKTKKR